MGVFIQSVRLSAKSFVKKFQSKGGFWSETIKNIDIQIVLLDMIFDGSFGFITQGQQVQTPNSVKMYALIDEVEEGFQGDFPVIKLDVS